VERMNHVVRKVDAKSGVIMTIAGCGKMGFGGDGGPATEAKMDQPHSIQLSADESALFICDIRNHRVRVVDLKRGMIDTLAGTGKAEATKDGAKFRKNCPLKGPRALDRDADGNLWLALREGNAVYKLDMKRGTIHHVAGTGKSGFTGNGGPAKEATLSGPKGVAVGPDGNVYLADTESHSVRMIDLSASEPVMRLIAGNGKKGAFARLHGIWVAADGKIYVGDSENHRIQVLSPEK
jgi:DNA-binding beta-propeller fold protein YncE